MEFCPECGGMMLPFEEVIIEADEEINERDGWFHRGYYTEKYSIKKYLKCNSCGYKKDLSEDVKDEYSVEKKVEKVKFTRSKTSSYNGFTWDASEAKDGSNSDGYNGGRGYYILISHNINGQSLTTQYYHLSQPLVSEGSTVTKGQIIAKSGGDPSSAGAGTSTGSHLHFGVHDGTSNQNPCTYLGLTTCSGDVSSQLK